MLVGKNAIDFTSFAILPDGSSVNNYNLYNKINGKYGLLFFYPMDFTFVCPSELLALNDKIIEFKERDVEVIAVSIDSHFVHAAWRATPVELGGIGNNIKYTLVADVKHSIIEAYGLKDEHTGVAFRGSFLIDKEKKIRIQHVNDFSIGRNITEYIRLFDALIFNSKHGNVCEAGWKKGSNGIVPTAEGVRKYLSSNYVK